MFGKLVPLQRKSVLNNLNKLIVLFEVFYDNLFLQFQNNQFNKTFG